MGKGKQHRMGELHNGWQAGLTLQSVLGLWTSSTVEKHVLARGDKPRKVGVESDQGVRYRYIRYGPAT